MVYNFWDFLFILWYIVYKKSLKIPKVQSEYANKRRTEKVKGKKTKGQTTIYKTQHRKLKIEKDEPGWKRG